MIGTNNKVTLPQFTQSSHGRYKVSTGWLPGLDLVRASAIFLVVWAHGRGLMPKDTALDQPWLAPAHWGIELFFALSGYLILGQLAELTATGSWRSLRVFCLKRFLRTIPVYWILLAILSLSLPWNLRFTVWLSESFFQRTFPIFSGGSSSLLVVNWSLAIEEMSYAILAAFAFALLLYKPVLTSRRISTRAILAGLMLALIVTGVASRFIAARHGFTLEQLKFSSVLHIDALAYGGLARLWADWQHSRQAKLGILPWEFTACLLPLTGLLGFLVRSAYLLEDRTAVDLNLHSSVAYFLSRILAAYLVMTMAALPALRLTHSRTWAVLIGSTSAASYSTYLLHQVLVLNWVNRLNPPSGMEWLIFIFYLMGSMVVGYLSFQLLEKPWIRLRRKLT
jgi:peptidoglycan/LPS O-acetylase OafA/YrhL